MLMGNYSVLDQGRVCYKEKNFGNSSKKGKFGKYMGLKEKKEFRIA